MADSIARLNPPKERAKSSTLPSLFPWSAGRAEPSAAHSTSKPWAPAVPSSSPSPLHSPQHPRPSAKSGRSAPPTPSSAQNPTFRDHRSHSRRGPLSPVSKHWEKGRSEASNGRSSPFRDAGSKRRNPVYISGDCSPRRSAVSPLTYPSASP